MATLLGIFQPLGIVVSELAKPQDGWLSADERCWLRPRPSFSHCGRFAVVLHGTIHNHLQVRAGLRFQAWQDEHSRETLVEGLAQRGPALLLDLRGTFSFAAYDNEKQQLLLARDRLGTKSLYICCQPNGLHFASDRRNLPGGDHLDRQTISQVLAFGHSCTPAFFPGSDQRGPVSLPAGMVVRINHSRPHNPVRYWPPQPRPDWSPLPIQNARRAGTLLRRQLVETVAQQLVADAPVACLLTSSVESAALAALANRQTPVGIDTVTVALPGMPANEIRAARRMAAHCGSRHHELVIEEHQALVWAAQALTRLDTLSSAGLDHLLICRAVAGEGIQVALSGLGADQLFGGTSTHRWMPWLYKLRWLPAPARQVLLHTLAPSLAPRLVGLPHWDRWHLALALHRWARDADLIAAGAAPLEWPEPPPERITQGWGKTSWAELFGTIEPMLLRDADAISTACGLEIRLPYLDHRIAEIALRMPQRFQSPGQRLLRDACIDLFPPGYVDRPKQRSSLPMASWMRGSLRDHCQARLEVLQHSGWLDPQWIIRQWQTFEAGQLPWHRVWTLVVLGQFCLQHPDWDDV